MGKNKPTVPSNTPDNPKRGQSKLRRNKGKLAMEKAAADEKTWCQSHDPLFKVKGKKRNRAV